MSDQYVLITPAGVTPQVITETVYELFFKYQGWTPSAVHVVTTATGEASVRARLLGKSGYFDHRRQPLPPSDAWARLCGEVLSIAPPPIEITLVGDGPTRLDDIRTPQQDRAFADSCYSLVAKLSVAGAPRLVGSISGGRKSMSAHVMNAFSALARPGDLLCHVLVNPPALESDRDFFYPTEPENQKVDLVELAYPQLRSFLVKSLLDGREPRGLSDLLEAVRPHLLAEQTPASVDLVLGDRRGHLRLYDDSGSEMSAVQLSASRMATLLVLANALCAHPDGVPDEALFDGEASRREDAERHPVHEARSWLVERLGSKDVTVWRSANDVSKTISELTSKGLDKKPLAARFFGAAKRDGGYRWPEPLPCPLNVRLAKALRPSESLFDRDWATHFPHLTYTWL